MESEYLQYLPRVFKGAPGNETDFLRQYLKIFEALLSGRKDSSITGLEESISQFLNYLDPGLTPVDPNNLGINLDSAFLTYLASWVALIFDQNWGLGKKRQWLQKIVPLYKKRGTKSGLLGYLNMFIGNQVVVEEPQGGFIIGKISTIGIDTYVGGAPVYYFHVIINYGYPPEDFDIGVWKNLRKGTKAIVDLEKPAHTYYDVFIRTSGIIVGERSSSIVGKNTLIWKKSIKV